MNQIMVVYWSQTGNTEAMANAVAEGCLLYTSILEEDVVGKEHYEVAGKVQQMLQKYKELQDLSLIHILPSQGSPRQTVRSQRPCCWDVPLPRQPLFMDL